MLRTCLAKKPNRSFRVLCLGAHSDDIEIGCGGAILEIIEALPDSEFKWVVLSGNEERQEEAQQSASKFLDNAQFELLFGTFRDGHFPFFGTEIKHFFEAELKSFDPDIIFTHRRKDLHQDHRLVSDLTWNTFRDHLILEYEVVKYDADLTPPNFYVPLSSEHAAKKVDILMSVFGSQRSKDWFDETTFSSLMRLRAVECRAPSGSAEAFHANKLVLGLT